MILPITGYGNKVLHKPTEELSEDYPKLNQLIENMFETMYHADGVGLAAPQVGLGIRMFVMDATPMAEEHPELKDFKKVFINPYVLEEGGEEWLFNEGCLSLPGIREDVKRWNKLDIEYYDENWNLKNESFEGIKARIMQHEYDHLDGIVFTDRLSPLRKRLLKSKLNNIAKGKVSVDYKMKFAIRK